MSETVYIVGQGHRLSPKMEIGSGGEANVYKLDAQTVLKRFKESNDPMYAAQPTKSLREAAQLGAAYRFKEMEHKLPVFPAALPPNVMAPLNLAFDQPASGRLVGYTMRYLNGMEVLLSLGDRAYREQGGIDGNQVVKAFRNLHQLVRDVHTAGVVIGDFNDLNVLTDAAFNTYLVDADSMQFGRYPCHTFTARFVDPLICEPDRLVKIRLHSPLTDWYAYVVMLFQSMLYIDPYGGVHKPPKGNPRLQRDQRELKRITVFDSNVIYPAKQALPLDVLPDDLLEYMRKVFEQDKREVFPDKLLDGLRWTTCTQCGTSHARPRCPDCAAPGAVKQTVVIRGTVTATRVFQTHGRLLTAAFQNGALRYLYHEGDAFKREGGSVVLPGNLDPEVRFRINGNNTLLGKRDKLFVLSPGKAAERLSTDTFRRLSMFDANDRNYFWISNDQLVANDRSPSAQFGNSNRFIGDVLGGQTMFWTGKKFGFGFYQAGQLVRAFVFNTDRQGINDQVPIPALPGQLIDATCVFSDTHAWFMTRTQVGGKLQNDCYVIDKSGALVATAQAIDGEDSWLASSIRGHLASGSSLFVATDEGIVQLSSDNGQVYVNRTYPDTVSFVSSATTLLPAPTGLYAVSNREIYLLEIK